MKDSNEKGTKTPAAVDYLKWTLLKCGLRDRSDQKKKGEYGGCKGWGSKALGWREIALGVEPIHKVRGRQIGAYASHHEVRKRTQGFSDHKHPLSSHGLTPRCY